MKLLDAINTVLPYLGEANVTSTTARNTTVQAVLQQIDTAKRTLLGTGWWFNRVKVTLYPGADGRIKAPINVFSWLPDAGISEIRGVLVQPRYGRLPVQLCTYRSNYTRHGF